jgi:hypothetical protein
MINQPVAQIWNRPIVSFQIDAAGFTIRRERFPNELDTPV